MKTTITADDFGRVRIIYRDEFGVIRDREFSCSLDGGYVWEIFDHGDRKQVCDELAYTGNTLYCPHDRDHLIGIIRREYRAMRRREKRESSRL